MTAGNDFQALEVSAKLPVAEFAAYAQQLRNAAGAAQAVGNANTEAMGKVLQFEGAEARAVNQAALTNKLLQEQTLILKSIASGMGDSGKKAAENDNQHKKLNETFGHGKHQMREYVQMGEHLTGMHSGLGSIIRMAVTPEFLAMGVAAMLVGEAIKMLNEGEEKLHEELEKVNANLLTGEQRLEAMARSHEHMTGAQRLALQTIREIKAEKEAEEWDKKNQLIIASTRSTMLWTFAAKTANFLGMGMVKTWKEGEVPQQNWIVRHNLLGVAMDHVNGKLKTIHEEEEKYLKRMNLILPEMDKRNAAEDRFKSLITEGAAALKSMQPPLVTYAQNLAIAAAQLDGTVDGLLRFNMAMNASLVLLKKQTDEQNKKGASAVNKKKEFYDHLAQLEAKGEKDSAARQIAAIRAELARDEATAKKVIKNRQELTIALLRLETNAEVQIKHIKEKETADDQAELDKQKAAHKRASDERVAQNKKDDQARHKIELDLLKMSAKTAKDRMTIFVKEQAAELEAFKERLKEEGIVGQQAEAFLTQYTQIQTEARIKFAKAEAAAKRDAMMEGLSQVASAMSQAFKGNKAMAIASATIDTYQSAVAAYKSMAGIPYVGPVLGALAAAAAIVAGIKNVQTIKSQNAEAPQINAQAHRGNELGEGSWRVNVQRGETGVVYPNTSHLMSISQAFTRIAQMGGRGGGRGGDTYVFHGPIHADRQSAARTAREHGRVLKRRNVQRAA